MIPARVLEKREEARVAGALTLLAAGFLGLCLLDDLTHTRILGGPHLPIYVVVATAILAAGLAPFFAWGVRGRTVGVRVGEGTVDVGGETIRAADVTSLSVARGAHGRSIAIARGKRTIFVEVERAEQADRIARALGVERLPHGEMTLRPSSRALAFFQGLAALVGVVCGPMYLLSVTLLEGTLHDGKELYGLTGVAAAALSAAILLARRLLPHQAIALRRTPFDTHVAMHLAEAESLRGEHAPPDADHATRIAPHAALVRGEEPVAAWLARLDGLPRDGHAYRGDATSRDVLWDTLGDGAAPVDARMAAARLLTRRHGEDERAVVRVVADPDVRVRVEAALEEEEDEAERRLMRLGPLFRAR